MTLQAAIVLLLLLLICSSCAVEGDVVVASVGADANGVIVGKDIVTVCGERLAGSVKGRRKGRLYDDSASLEHLQYRGSGGGGNRPARCLWCAD